MTIEEVEALTGISAVKMTDEGVVKTASVSDPPKKASAAEVAAETEAIRNAIESATSDGEYEKPPIFLLKRDMRSRQTPMRSCARTASALKIR